MVIELDRDRIIKRIGYIAGPWRVFIVKGIGFVGACEIITEGPGAFGQSGRAVVIIKNFVKFCSEGFVEYHIPPEYLIVKLRNTRINDPLVLRKIEKIAG